jgi:hypothetical protein
MTWTRNKTIATVATGSVLMLGLGTTTALAVTGSHSAPRAAVTAPASPAAAPKASPPAQPPVKITINNTPTIIVQAPPAPGSTVYVPVPAYAPQYVADNEAVVRQYYQDINSHDYASAWAMGGSNLNGGTGYDAWVAGYATTSWDSLSTWQYYPGSNAVQVTITATETDGSVRTYAGSYTVSNGVITGGNLEQTSGGSAAPAAPAGLRYVGNGVYAGPNTSDAFALSVKQAYVDGGYWYQPGTSQFYVYSSVTGQSYLMTSSSVGNPVVVTGGNGALVQFNFNS